MIHLLTNLLLPVSAECVEYLPRHWLGIEGGRIVAISNNPPAEDWLDFSNCLCTPGLIDAHVHLSQLRATGKYRPDLLQWLETFIFPEEMKAHDPAYAEMVAEEFFTSLIASGTTTAVVYVAPDEHATDIAFRVAERTGVRAIIGKTMMDCHAPDGLREDTEVSLAASLRLCERWHRRTSRLEYVFTPRFAPVCTPQLLKAVGAAAREHDAYIQTHLAENLNELARVAELFPQARNYTEVYADSGLLGPKTLLAHCIHLDPGELERIRRSGAKVVHCPDSNFFLQSGVFPWREIRAAGIPIALGSDVGAGTTLSLLHTMKMAMYRQDEQRPTLAKVFWWATGGGAEVLGKTGQIGTLSVGAEADLTLWNLSGDLPADATEAVSRLVFTTLPVRAVYVAGQRLR